MPLADVLRREERLEDVRQDLRVDALTGIAHDDGRVVAGREARMRRCRADLDGQVVGADRQVAALWHRVARVDDEVHDHLLQL